MSEPALVRFVMELIKRFPLKVIKILEDFIDFKSFRFNAVFERN
jgi:hypothetical protein